MTLTLSQIHAELLRIYAHDLTPTNVLAVERMPNGDVRFETDTSELEEQLAEAKQSEARLEAELKQTEEGADRLEAENQKLAQMHEEFADKESGITPATYHERAEAAEKARQLFRDGMVEARAERDALRKRKGITCELFKHEREVLTLLSHMARGSAEFTAIKTRANELLKKLHTP